MEHTIAGPNLQEILKNTELKAEMIRKLISAVSRITSTKKSSDASVWVKHFTDVRRDVKVWSVTPSYAIDAFGNILWKWPSEDRDWPHVSYEMVLLSNVGIKGMKELCDHLDEVCPCP